MTDSRIQQIIDEIAVDVGIKSGGTQTVSSGTQGLGVYDDIEDAIRAAKSAQKELMTLSLDKRCEIIAAMRSTALDNARHLAVLANEETGFGRVEDKVLKNILAAEKTPGVEDLIPTTFTGDYGMTLVECAPYGVIGAITPSTNPSATAINNSISMVAAGNAVVYNPHPGAKKVTIESIRLLNEAIAGAGGPATLLCTVANPTLDSSKVIMTHEDIRMLAVTGGEAVVSIAMKSGKKVIAAGPGNPPVIVDDTACIPDAAQKIVNGASFDNNILCIAEKEVFVFDTAAGQLISEMMKHGCYKLTQSEILKLEQSVVVKDKEGNWVANKEFVGKNASYILEKHGIRGGDSRLIIAEVSADHPFVKAEMLMPVLPIVRVSNLDEAIDRAITAENGCKHTAMMHSENVNNLTKAARALDTTIFVKNAPSYAGLGFEGEGFTTLTIATPTGEGLTSARSFVRSRRCTLSGAFRVV